MAPDDINDPALAAAVDKQRRIWAKEAKRYDRQMAFWERVLFGDARAWVCAQASGDVLEVAIGTGRDLPFYPPDIRLTGLDLSPEMLAIAKDAASHIGRTVTLKEGDAHQLPYPDESFDTVVCVFSLCNITDMRKAIAEMHRVLRPGGPLLLADHVISTNPIARGVQRAFEKLTIRLAGDHQTRRPLPIVTDTGFTIERRQRDKLGIVERITAHKPSCPHDSGWDANDHRRRDETRACDAPTPHWPMPDCHRALR
ncbi:class I SAM-dependent methyltransferase [Solicola gregarius]|uniref:Methyltransferase domain-containing protein n=1 Tax=Solicola gregarius TaxID=2908642 RepID=A0AA46YKE0_9ACTN|nr:methyltransferase domain-containing protein [Solicola gregarius]UYM05670.1 methyltransferase domain-containing protein [Solicola gregarius]